MTRNEINQNNTWALRHREDLTYAGARDGQETGRDSPANFCPGPACAAGQSCGTVPRKFVPVQRDTKSAGTDRDLRPAGQSRESRHI